MDSYKQNSINFQIEKDNSFEDCIFWLENFKKKKGRPLKILHIGNIANNAYLNAKLQREHGIIADVICHDYTHIMGCPEWEDAEFIDSWGDDFYPNFKIACSKDFKRPEWFYTGTRVEAINKISREYNIRKLKVNKISQIFLSLAKSFYRSLFFYYGKIILFYSRSNFLKSIKKNLYKIFILFYSRSNFLKSIKKNLYKKK